MTYVDGFVIPVKRGKIEAYRKIARKAARLWKEYGALDYKECVADHNPRSKYCTTFPRAFRSKAGEVVIFSYIVYRSRAHRDTVNKKIMKDPRLHAMCKPEDMPFDCRRMAYGGFKEIAGL